jgi:hypothetical protein
MTRDAWARPHQAKRTPHENKKKTLEFAPGHGRTLSQQVYNCPAQPRAVIYISAEKEGTTQQGWCMYETSQAPPQAQAQANAPASTYSAGRVRVLTGTTGTAVAHMIPSHCRGREVSSVHVAEAGTHCFRRVGRGEEGIFFLPVSHAWTRATIRRRTEPYRWLDRMRQKGRGGHMMRELRWPRTPVLRCV